MKNNLLFLTAVVMLGACSGEDEIIIPWSDSRIAYEGRIDTSRIDAAELYWSGTSVRINFKGTSVEALMKESRGDNYYNVILDDSLFIWRPDTLKEYQVLATGLDPGKHSLELFKRTEWDRGHGEFYGFRIRGRAKMQARPERKKRKIEFYGNSITAGYAVEDFSGKDRPDSTFTNNYLSYSTLVARHYDADYRCICKSGIGITISWFPLIMPEIYDRINPEDPSSIWDFSLFQPDIVVINLMQNDSWLTGMPDHPQFRARFEDTAPGEGFIVAAYQDFVAGIRDHYPEAQIICALGNMDATRQGSEWPGYVTRAVENLQDSRIHTFFVPFKETPGHPTIREQEEMAAAFIRFIDEQLEDF